METVPRPDKYFSVKRKSGDSIHLKAESYCDTGYGTFAFYREEIEEVNKSYLKGSPLVPIFELPRKTVSSIEEIGVAEFQVKPKAKKKPVSKRVPKAAKPILKTILKKIQNTP
jgi:hypothetical protein